MRILAIETATEACSVALFEDGEVRGARHELLGRGHAEWLVPLIAELPGKGRADEIRVSLGPGSFTGTRIGLAAAGALGIAWGSRVLGYPTLALVAATAHARHPGPVTVCMTGGHGEWFVQDFDAQGLPEHAVRSRKPEAVLQDIHYSFAAGSKARELLQGGGSGTIALDILPDAAHALDLPSAVLTDRLSPRYGRPPDAKLPG